MPHMNIKASEQKKILPGFNQKGIFFLFLSSCLLGKEAETAHVMLKRNGHNDVIWNVNTKNCQRLLTENVGL